MEDAQVKSGNGLVDRSKPEEEMEGISVAEYAKMRQANQPGKTVELPMSAAAPRPPLEVCPGTLDGSVLQLLRHVARPLTCR